jgi:hypothetical protein
VREPRQQILSNSRLGDVSHERLDADLAGLYGLHGCDVDQQHLRDLLSSEQRITCESLNQLSSEHSRGTDYEHSHQVTEWPSSPDTVRQNATGHNPGAVVTVDLHVDRRELHRRLAIHALGRGLARPSLGRYFNIEGSTRLARRLGAQWPLVIDDHHRSLDSVIAAHAGFVERPAGMLDV